MFANLPIFAHGGRCLAADTDDDDDDDGDYGDGYGDGTGDGAYDNRNSKTSHFRHHTHRGQLNLSAAVTAITTTSPKIAID